MSTKFFASFLPVVISVSLFAGLAAAEPCSATLADTVLKEGKALDDQGQTAQACEKFRVAYECNTEYTLPLYMLGQCEEKLGRVGSAFSDFSELQRKELLAGRPQRATIAENAAKAVEPRVPHLMINASEEVKTAPGLKVTLNNDPVLPATFGVDRRPNPGSYDVVVTADGREPWKTTVTLAEKESKVVDLQLGPPHVVNPHLTINAPEQVKKAPGLKVTLNNDPVLPARFGGDLFLKPGSYEVVVTADGRKPWKITVALAEKESRVLELQLGRELDDPGATQRTLGLIAGGLGIVGIGFGSFEGLSAIGKNDDSKDHCTAQNLCDDTGLTLRSDAIDAANLSTIGFIAGGALLAGGAFLYFTAPSSDDPPATTGLWIGPSSVSLRGAF